MHPIAAVPAEVSAPRRRFLAAATGAAVGSTLSAPLMLRAAEKPLLSFGVVADPQYADVAQASTRFYRASIAKLREAVAHFNTLELAFCVNLGDLIDRQWGSYEAILRPLAECRHQVHHVLGNHDFELAEEFKPRVPERLRMPGRYFAVDHGPWRFVILDTNDLSVYAHSTTSPQHVAAAAELHRLRATGAINAQAWNGGVGDRQLAWFDAACRGAGAAGQRVLVFAHHPVYPPNAHNVWNAERVLDIIGRHRCVVGWLNGHNHAGAFGVHDGVPCITLRGMVETEDTNAYAVAHLHADRLELIGHGREPSRELLFRKA